MGSPESAALVYLETFSNQRYIFSTNRLRQNVGASELTFQAGTVWVLEALGHDVCRLGDAEALREHLLSPDRTRLEDGADHEVIYAVSGKALVLVRSEDQGQQLVREVTRRVLTDAPGLEMLGAVSDEFTWRPDEDASALHGRIGAVARRQVGLRARMPGPAARGPRLPLTASCASSGQPAADVINVGGTAELASREVAAKHRAAQRGIDRIQALAPEGTKLPSTLDELVARAEDRDAAFGKERWIAVIHADGNGVGGMFGAFDEHLSAHLAQQRGDEQVQASARDYIDWLRRFSLSLDLATTLAFQDGLEAVRGLEEQRRTPSGGDGLKSEAVELPVLPLILGGDDLSVVCAGRAALPFVVTFLRRFEHHTAARLDDVGDVIASIAQQALGTPRMAAAAGVAITKPHFPFFEGHELAEQLMSSAKQVKQRVVDTRGDAVPCGAVDVHVLYDSSNADLPRIRQALTLADAGASGDAAAATEVALTARPYVLDEPSDVERCTQASREWIGPRRWRCLLDAVAALQPYDADDGADGASGGEERLARSQVQRLRAALFHGRSRADAELERLRRRAGRGLQPLLGDTGASDGSSPTLFWHEPRDDGGMRAVTRLLDAIELRDFIDVDACDLDTVTPEGAE